MADGIPIPEWRTEYDRRLSLYERLATEVSFALDATTRNAEIKTHLITSRVKSFESLGRKARQRELSDPLEEVMDLVGIRVVVLFLSDLPALDALIRDSFHIHSAEDKIASADSASFGYMSVHYSASLGEKHKGPRYDGLKEQRFEIQTRTIVMDAWANVSHYLDYKGSSTIPEDLRRDFFALSGLFYVADQHFEMLAERAEHSQAEAKREVRVDPREEVEVNLDTIQAFLLDRYPNRGHADRQSIGELVDEIVDAGYNNLAELATGLDAGEPALAEYENELRATGDQVPFFDLGAARLSLAYADRNYASRTYPSDPYPKYIRNHRLWKESDQ